MRTDKIGFDTWMRDVVKSIHYANLSRMENAYEGRNNIEENLQDREKGVNFAEDKRVIIKTATL